MGLWSAAPFLVGATLRNRVLAQARRLKNPKYLVATAAGLFYVWVIFLRRLVFSSDRVSDGAGLPRDALMFIEGIMVIGALLVILMGWVFGSNRSALRYTEAEIQFLFAGPVSRKQILHYKLARMLAQTLASALITTLLFGRNLAGHPLYFVLGSFLAIGTLGLHLTGASLTRESLAKHGRYGVIHRVLTLAGVLAVLGGFVGWVLMTKPPLPMEADAEAWIGYVRALYEAGPLKILLFPIRAPLQVALAQDFQHFAYAVPVALAVLAANYLWVMSSDHAFEEAAVQHSESWARRVEAWRTGQQQPLTGAQPFRLKLSPTGRPEWALGWKALVAARRLLRLGLVPALIALAFGVGVLVFSYVRGHAGVAVIGIATTCALLGALTAVIGPMGLALDLRRDLLALDVLKSLPLTGRQLVIGELAGPFLMVVAAQWFLWLIALGLGLVPSPYVPLELRIGVPVAAMVVGPALSAAGFVLANTAVLLFPAWASNEPRRGVEAIGQRILALAGGLIVLTVGILPASIAGGAAFLLLMWLGAWVAGILLGAVVAAAVLFLEVALCVAWMGRLFDRLDITE